MEAGGMEALKVLEASLSQAKWRLKSASKRRLETDILALCTGIRPVIMVDYGGKMPELQERLCEVLKLSQQESSIYQHLRVMVIEDMIYLVHVQGLAKFVMSSLNSETKLLFVDLEQDPPKMITQTDESSVVMQLVSVQKLFSLAFPVDGMNSELLPCHGRDPTASDKSPISELVISQSSEFIDLSCCLQETQVTIPTLNGNGTFNKGYKEEELMSFSVPYDLSMGGSNEPWAEAFLAHMQAKWERCKQVWSSLHMEVSGCYPHAIVL
ncbi:uncharacterized protein LOC130750954 isoform X5 [Actinidia eriantha]|uniref:uncharacterized protein LOC130750954 isoform X5 n=1 Tax=Actinidia eriantha TaxID=165200 RepID=UPI00258E9DE9|nr:uncharacterized protein LOC130750954 isoform X5 [Actinidia eriantha]